MGRKRSGAQFALESLERRDVFEQPVERGPQVVGVERFGEVGACVGRCAGQRVQRVGELRLVRWCRAASVGPGLGSLSPAGGSAVLRSPAVTHREERLAAPHTDAEAELTGVPACRDGHGAHRIGGLWHHRGTHEMARG